MSNKSTAYKVGFVVTAAGIVVAHIALVLAIVYAVTSVVKWAWGA